jgi:hypothetical protein
MVDMLQIVTVFYVVYAVALQVLVQCTQSTMQLSCCLVLLTVFYVVYTVALQVLVQYAQPLLTHILFFGSL